MTSTAETVLYAQRLLTSADADLIVDAAVLIAGDRIVFAGSRSDLPRPAENEIDLGTLTLLPGLFDCHVHLSFEEASATAPSEPPATTESHDARAAIMMARGAQLLLNSGVTTARDLGSAGAVAPIVRDAIHGGLIPGPRLQVANSPVTVTGGHAWSMGGEADGVTAVVATVRELRKRGSDLIKIMSTGGFITAGSRPWEARFTAEELSAACHEAHVLGMRVTTHAQSVEGIRRAVLAGVDCIEHCAWVTRDGIQFDQEVADLIAERGVFVCPTMDASCVSDPYFCPWGPRDQVLENLARMRASGITLIAGTDCGIPLVPPDAYFDGLAVLEESGMTPREVIRAGTVDAADACGLSSVTGRLAPGMVADIIGVVGDPTTDIGTLRTPPFVMARGQSMRVSPPREIRTPRYREQAHAFQQQLHQASGRAAAAIGVPQGDDR